MSRAWVLVALAAGLAGCGGPSDREQLERWVRGTDAACEQGERPVARRGAPRNLTELLERAPAGSRDARAAIRNALAVRMPEGAARTAGPVRAAMRRLAATLRPLGSIRSELRGLRELDDAIDDLDDSLASLERAAHGAGLHICGRAPARAAVVDGLRGVVFAQGFSQHALRFAGRSTRAVTGSASPAAVEQTLIDLALYIGDEQNATARLEPPSWGEAAVERYEQSLLDFRAVVGDARSANLATPLGPARARRQLDRVSRAFERPTRAAEALLDFFEERLDRAPRAEPGSQPS